MTRFLHKHSEYGYTNRQMMALPGEPEAISQQEQNVISIRARAEFAEQRQEETKRRDNQLWLDRLRRAEMSATSKGIDIFRSQAAIRKEILNIEQRLNGGGTLVSA